MVCTSVTIIASLLSAVARCCGHLPRPARGTQVVIRRKCLAEPPANLGRRTSQDIHGAASRTHRPLRTHALGHDMQARGVRHRGRTRGGCDGAQRAWRLYRRARIRHDVGPPVQVAVEHSGREQGDLGGELDHAVRREQLLLQLSDGSRCGRRTGWRIRRRPSQGSGRRRRGVGHQARPVLGAVLHSAANQGRLATGLTGSECLRPLQDCTPVAVCGAAAPGGTDR
jgi:hypothetical protein